jgi:hypothetical protein
LKENEKKAIHPFERKLLDEKTSVHPLQRRKKKLEGK